MPSVYGVKWEFTEKYFILKCDGCRVSGGGAVILTPGKLYVIEASLSSD